MEDKRYHLILEIINHTDTFVGDPFFVTGNFNNWTPDTLSLGTIPSVGEKKQFVLRDLKEGLLELKISRGSWSTLTSTVNGKLEAPYTVEVGQNSTLNIQINGWRDTFPPSTASPQVHVLDEAFYFPEMDAVKTIWIYLPKAYQTSAKRYPVIYMHDGQHLFDEATSAGRTGPVEWEVDETVDGSSHEAIVVAIASAADPQTRKSEYLLNPTDLISYPQGRAYLADIVSTLKPFIDKDYRTLSDFRNTAMVGSSLGGLVTIYAGLLYPDTFGCLGVFSPSIWMDDSELLFETVENVLQNQKTGLQKQNYYLYGGQLEKRSGPNSVTVNMIENIRYFASLFHNNSRFRIEMDINPLGKHGALYWQKVFPDFYEWWHKTLL